MARCEACQRPATKRCGDIEQATLGFCDEHYRQHVRDAHGGIPLPGCISPKARGGEGEK